MPKSNSLHTTKDKSHEGGAAAVPDLESIPGTYRQINTLPSASHYPSDEVEIEGLQLLKPLGGCSEHEIQYELDVVAIHGLNGHPINTWTCKETEPQVFWLRDLLPQALPGARIYTYGYNSNVFFSQSPGDISSYAKGLLDRLVVVRKSIAVYTLFMLSPSNWRI